MNMADKSRLSLWQAAWVVARRDFQAILFSKAFLLFLLGPIFFGAISIGAGMLGAKAADSASLIAAMTQRYPTAGMGVALQIGAKVAKGEMKWG